MKTTLNLTFIIPFTFLIWIASVSLLQAQQYTVVLDAGHGGKDPRKQEGMDIMKKKIALNITLAVGKFLEKDPNIKVIYTRKKDVFVGASQ